MVSFEYPRTEVGEADVPAMKDAVSYLVAVEAKLGIRRTLVLALAVWMTWRISIVNDDFIGNSRAAFNHLFDVMDDAYNRGEEIWIKVT